MGDLMYATIVILIIWGGIFLYLNLLNRRLKRLEQLRASGDSAAGSTVVTAGSSPSAVEPPPRTDEPQQASEG